MLIIGGADVQVTRLYTLGEVFHTNCNWTSSTLWFFTNQVSDGNYTNKYNIAQFKTLGTDPSLTIYNLQFKHSGIYYCLGKKANEDDEFLAAVPIIVYGMFKGF